MAMQCCAREHDGYMDWLDCQAKGVVSIEDKWYCRKHLQQEYSRMLGGLGNLQDQAKSARQQIRRFEKMAKGHIKKVK